MRLIMAAAGAALLASAAPAHAQSVSIKDASSFWSMLKTMGYQPTPLTDVDSAPEFDITIDGFVSTLRMVGCPARKNCKYITLIGSYTDVINPPQSWIQQMNDEYDLLRVGTEKKTGRLYMFGGYVIEGLPQSELRRIFDYWGADTAGVGQEAIDGGHTTKD
jgi:hypothetical protein